MKFFSPRDTTVTNIIAALNGIKAAAGITLVKAYEGEFYRFYLKSQVQAETFPAEVNLQAPFVLVSSRSRPVQKQENRAMTLKHEISLLVGITNNHDFTSTGASPIFDLLLATAEAVAGGKFHENAGKLCLENDGVFLAKTDLFTVYEQQFYQLERAET